MNMYVLSSFITLIANLQIRTVKCLGIVEFGTLISNNGTFLLDKEN